MIKSKILCVLWIIFAVIYFVVFDNYLAYFLLIFTTILFVYLIISVRITSHYINIEIEMQESIHKNTIEDSILVIENKSVFPVPYAKCRVICTNLLTGEKQKADVSFAIKAKSKEKVSWKLKISHCGQINLKLTKMCIYDGFGIFAKLQKADNNTHVFVYPQTYPLNVELGRKNIPNSDSEYYADDRKGYDSGETYGIRDYVPGDSIKLIHWKLTNKLDKTVIRELGFPIQNSALILLETASSLGGVKTNPAVCDAMFEAFFSVSGSLLANQIPHTVSWYDYTGKSLASYDLNAVDELAGIQQEVLSIGTGEDEPSVIYQYLNVFSECKAAHIVYITYNVIKEDVEQLLKNSVATVLQCVPDEYAQISGVTSDENSGLTVIPFYTDSIEADLSQLSV